MYIENIMFGMNNNTGQKNSEVEETALNVEKIKAHI